MFHYRALTRSCDLSSFRGSVGASFVAPFLRPRAIPLVDSSIVFDASVVAIFFQVFFQLFPVPAAELSILGIFIASSPITFCRPCSAMPDADASLRGELGASFAVAHFPLRSVPDADSSVLRIVGASFEAAFFRLCSVPPADSSFLGNVGAPFVAASVYFHRCPVPGADSSFLGNVGAPILTAFATKAFSISDDATINISPSTRTTGRMNDDPEPPHRRRGGGRNRRRRHRHPRQQGTRHGRTGR